MLEQFLTLIRNIIAECPRNANNPHQLRSFVCCSIDSLRQSPRGCTLGDCFLVASYAMVNDDLVWPSILVRCDPSYDIKESDANYVILSDEELADRFQRLLEES